MFDFENITSPAPSEIANEEIWKDIPEWEGLYQASSLGRIRRMKATTNTKVGQILKPGWNGAYHIIALSNRPALKKTYLLHNVIALTFSGPRPDGMDIDHVDGNKKNNTAENLQYVTRSENHYRAVALGLWPVGLRNGNAKLSDDQIRQIRTRPEGLKTLAAEFGVDRTTIWSIRTWRTGKHVV